MIEHGENHIVLSHDGGLWSAQHDPESAAGPLKIRIGDDTVVENCRFHIDDFEPESMVVERFRAHHRGGAAVVEASGLFPFGNEIRLGQTFRYAANHVRITSDLNWPKATEVRRHFALGDLFLPGHWHRFYVFPPLTRLNARRSRPAWHDIPQDSRPGTMIGHWHRPPLAVVFERPDGTRLEVGTGSDVWRWESCLGYCPESGSYKITVEADGIRFIREPLMCCLPYTPAAGQRRFTWHLAWYGTAFPGPRQFPPAETLRFENGKLGDFERDVPAKTPSVVLDTSTLPVPASARKALSAPDLIRGKLASVPCWESHPVSKLARSVIRRLAAMSDNGYLRIKGLLPQPCHVAGHVDRRETDGVAHWDINGILDFCVWARRQLGESWEMRLENRLAEILPSLRCLELPNGFDPQEMVAPKTDMELGE